MNSFEKLIEQLYFRIPNNLAIYDQLTGVYNANWLYKIGKKKYSSKVCYITLIDLNNFKKINDIAGHAMGNGMLIALGKQLSCLKSIDETVECCRLGGDEFLIFSSMDLSSFLVDDSSELLSFGIFYKNSECSVENAIKQADIKMYKYKKKFKKDIKSNKDIVKIIRNMTRKRKALGE